MNKYPDKTLTETSIDLAVKNFILVVSENTGEAAQYMVTLMNERGSSLTPLELLHSVSALVND